MEGETNNDDDDIVYSHRHISVDRRMDRTKFKIIEKWPSQVDESDIGPDRTWSDPTIRRNPGRGTTNLGRKILLAFFTIDFDKLSCLILACEAKGETTFLIYSEKAIKKSFTFWFSPSTSSTSFWFNNIWWTTFFKKLNHNLSDSIGLLLWVHINWEELNQLQQRQQ